MNKKYAFTLIELIFAIVIIGIAAMTLPTMSQTSNQSMQNNIVQEAILLASLELKKATSGSWDNNSLDANSTYAEVIQMAAADCNATTKLRPGHISQPKHRKCLDNLTIVAADANSLLPDYNINNAVTLGRVSMIDNYLGAADGYKQQFFNQITVTNDGNGTKEINITITDANNNVITRLSTLGINVGEVGYHSREY